MLEYTAINDDVVVESKDQLTWEVLVFCAAAYNWVEFKSFNDKDAAIAWASDPKNVQ